MLTQCSTSLLKNFERASDESFSRDETQRVISYEVSFHKYLTIFHGRNKMSVIQKALVQLNLNLTVPKSSRSHFLLYKNISESSSLIHFEWFVYQYAVAAGRRSAVAWVPIRNIYVFRVCAVAAS